MGRDQSDTRGGVTVTNRLAKMAEGTAPVSVIVTNTETATDLSVQLMVDGLPGNLGSLPARAL